MNRSKSKFIKLISVDNTGDIRTLNINLPTSKDRFIKACRKPYKASSREIYNQYLDSLKGRIEKNVIINNLIAQNKKLELLARKNSARVIANSLNKIILNIKEE